MNAFSPAPADTLGGQALAAARTAAWRLATLLAAPFAAMARHHRIHRTALMLQELDDRTLADIGLHRAYIDSTAARVIDWPHVDPRRVTR
jgi:uncharacterized protein YjiS (DUF1127 family)